MTLALTGQILNGYQRALPPASVTREEFVHSIRALVAQRITGQERDTLLGAKLVYGAGNGDYRGICYYDAWTNGQRHSFIEIAATGEESTVQLAGTTVHELGHALAFVRSKGVNTGHGAEWASACRSLGLEVKAIGQQYDPSHFDPLLWAQIAALPSPTDGRPTFGLVTGFVAGLLGGKVRPCPMGKGSRGGKSQGPGSGSRLRLYHCACIPPVKVRAASDTLAAHCDVCGEAFEAVNPKPTES